MVCANSAPLALELTQHQTPSDTADTLTQHPKLWLFQALALRSSCANFPFSSSLLTDPLLVCALFSVLSFCSSFFLLRFFFSPQCAFVPAFASTAFASLALVFAWLRVTVAFPLVAPLGFGLFPLFTCCRRINIYDLRFNPSSVSAYFPTLWQHSSSIKHKSNDRVQQSTRL